MSYVNHLGEITKIREVTRFNAAVGMLHCNRGTIPGCFLMRYKPDSVTWDHKSCTWKMKLHDVKTGEEFTDETNILVNAGGILSQPKLPSLDGLEIYKGELLHSAHWRTVDLKGKRVALVGAGSSAIQILPKIQAEAGHIDTYIRSSTWVSH